MKSKLLESMSLSSLWRFVQRPLIVRPVDESPAAVYTAAHTMVTDSGVIKGLQAMELAGLLGTEFDCDCGRRHRLPVRRFVHESGAIARLPAVLEEIVPAEIARRIVIVADTRTWSVAGARACEALREAGLHAEHVIVADREQGGPVCDDVTVAGLKATLGPLEPDMVVAVGSGVINDLCKWSSFDLGVPYVVVATAASMNGYAAANVAATIDGVKVLTEARPPWAVLAEPEIITAAPAAMTTAGFGDTIAKYQSHADWRINHVLLDEYYCGFCAGMINSLEPLFLEHPEDIKERDPRAVGGLFEALFWSGVAMTLVGTSAPASGGEHLLSHTLDMISGVQGRPHDLHGRQVGVGTIFSAALYERLLALDGPAFTSLPATVDADYWNRPGLIAAVKSQYHAKQAHVEAVRQSMASPPAWDALRTSLATVTQPPGIVRDWLRRAGGAVTAEDIGCSRPALRAALLHMHEMRRRFTVVDLAWMAGVLPAAVDDIIDAWLSV